jgi:hypothetical protein
MSAVPSHSASILTAILQAPHDEPRTARATEWRNAAAHRCEDGQTLGVLDHGRGDLAQDLALAVLLLSGDDALLCAVLVCAWGNGWV